MDSEMNMSMPVGPVYGAGGNQSGFGFGGDWAWILLLLVLFGNNGWGNGFGGGGFDGLYPWMNNSQNINGGFRDQMLGNQIGGIHDAITSGFGDVQTALCGGFAGVNAAITNTQMANMQQMNGLASQFANCCCENRLGIANLGADIAREACADRAAVSAYSMNGRNQSMGYSNAGNYYPQPSYSYGNNGMRQSYGTDSKNDYLNHLRMKAENEPDDRTRDHLMRMIQELEQMK